MSRCMSLPRVLLVTVILPLACPAAVPMVRGQAELDRKFAKDYATARALIDQAKFQEAEAAIHELAARAKKQWGPDDVRVGEAKHYLPGALELARRNFAAAEKHFTKALAEFDRLKATKHPARLRAANDLGVMHFHRAEFAPSKQWFAEALAARRIVLGPSHADTLQSLRNHAFAEHALGNYADSQRQLREAFAGMTKLLDDESAVPASSAEAMPLVESKLRFPRIQVVRGFYFVVDTSKPRPLNPKVDAARAQAFERLGLLAFHVDGTPKPSEFTAKALVLHEKLYGVEDPRSAVVLHNHFAMLPDNPGTRTSLQLARERLTKVLPEGHPIVATVHRNLAVMSLPGNIIEANRNATTAFQLRRAEKLKADHPAYADLHVIVGLIHQNENRLQDARLEFVEALRMRQKSLGPAHLDTATASSALGVVHYYQGDYRLARTFIKAALRVRQQNLGKEHADSARLLSDYGVLLKEEGDYVNARQVMEEAYTTLLKTVGKFDIDTPTARSNLEVVRMEMGDYDGASTYFASLLQDPKFADSLLADDALLNLGSIARYKGNLQLALATFQQAEKKLAAFRAGEVYNNLAAVHRDLGNFDQAEQYLQKALTVWRARGQDTPQEAFTLTSLGLFHQNQGRVGAARDHFHKALAIYRAKVGPNSRYTANLLQFLGIAQMLDGKADAARQSLHEALAIKTVLARDLLPTMTEAEALAFAASLEERDPLLSVLHDDRAANAAAAYQAVWLTRGLATRAITARRQAAIHDPQALAVVDELRTTRTQLASQIRQREANFAFQQFNDQFTKTLTDLNARKEKLEQRLAKLLGQAPPSEQSVAETVNDLQARLPTKVAVVDLVKAKVWEKKGKQPIARPVYHYEAFVLHAGKTPVRWVTLGPAAPIDEAVQQWRRYYGNSKTAQRGATLDDEPKGEGADSGVKLRQLVWDRLAVHLDNVNTVIILADGELTRLPWAALPGKVKNSFLLEEKAIAVASHGQQLATLLAAAAPTGNKALLVGGLVYDKPAAQTGPVGLPTYRNADLPVKERAAWNYLPGTLAEVQQIAKLVPQGWQAELLEGRNAPPTGAHNQWSRVRYLHLATHGFFTSSALQPPRIAKVQPRDGLLSAQLFDARHPLATLTGRNPMVLSGLVLSGAGLPPGQATVSNDGILTAEEIVDLDLRGLELVVLSACDTGLGEVAGGEGVLGLQRAFALAGARTTIGSLWKVDDTATQLLMVEFYNNLWQGKRSKLEALRQAQITLMRRYEPQTSKLRASANERRLTPYYWAAFVLAGDWR